MIGPPKYVSPVVPPDISTEVTVPLPPPPPEIQLPFIEKHPAVKLIPFANVDEAVALVALKMLALIPPVNVLVAVVVALKNPPVKKLALNSFAEGTFSIPFTKLG